MLHDLNGKVAVITGGSAGIGLAAAKRLAREGVLVFVFARRQTELDRALAEICPSAVAVRGDVSSLDDLDRLYDTVRERAGRLDIVLANAGVLEAQPLGQITEESADRLFGINVKGVIFTVQKALPLLRDGGSVILTSSIGADMGVPAKSVYNATKAAIRALARSWIVDLKGSGVRVNVLTPGSFVTEGMRAAFPDEAVLTAKLAQIGDAIPLRRVGDPAELANVAAFLASDASSYINGADIQVDGGLGQI